MEINLAGRTALVTGGNSGIGGAISKALAGAGADVAITYLTHPDPVIRDPAPDRKLSYWRLDATDSAEVARVFAQAASRISTAASILPDRLLTTPLQSTPHGVYSHHHARAARQKALAACGARKRWTGR